MLYGLWLKGKCGLRCSHFVISLFFIFCFIMIEGRANEISDFQVFKTVIKYCLVIIVLPLLSFFVSKTVLFDGLLQLEAIKASVYSAVVAVLVLHVTLGAYIYRAYSEADDKPAPKPVKKD